MTYHSQLPHIVMKRWQDLNPEYIVTTILNILNGKILTSGKSEMLKEFNNYVGLSITKHIDLYKRIME